MNSDQFRRYLIKQGCIIDASSGKGGHVLVRRGELTSVLPTHGGAKQLGTGLKAKIKKDLDVK
jgi:mRNA interferase HicA